jgi:uncharacterized protein (DUF983 family)
MANVEKEKRTIFSRPLTENQLADLRDANNPKNELTGDFTGRCRHCGSKDLWDDNLAYGCNVCGALLGTN